MTIAIIGAMPEEISAIQTQLQNTLHQRIASVDFYTGKIGNTDIALVCSGIGKVHAALAATLAIQQYQPSYIINVGTLGALYSHLKPTTLILAESVLYHDVDVTGFGYAHGQIPNMPGDYQASHQLLTLFEKLAAHENLSFHKGVGVTGDQFIANTETLNTIKTKFPHALGIDMEAAAIAHVAHLFRIPFISVRAISDHGDETSAAMFDQHLVSSADTVGNLVVKAIPEITNLI